MTSERLFDPCRQGYHDNCVAVDRGDRCTCGCHAGSAEVIAIVTELSMTQAKLAATEAELAAAREQLAEARAREHVLVIVGDKLARHLEWIIGEPNSGFVPEVVDAVKASSRKDVDHWLNTIHQFGFKCPEERAQAAVAEGTGRAARAAAAAAAAEPPRGVEGE